MSLYGLTEKQRILVERFLQLKPDTLEDIVRLIEKVAEDFAKNAGKVETVETPSTPSPVPLEAKNPHEYTDEDAREALEVELSHRRHEGGGQSDSGTGNSGTASA